MDETFQSVMIELDNEKRVNLIELVNSLQDKFPEQDVRLVRKPYTETKIIDGREELTKYGYILSVEGETIPQNAALELKNTCDNHNPVKTGDEIRNETNLSVYEKLANLEARIIILEALQDGK